jgi:ribosomal-protein-alanine N-acetyltransferase
MTRSRRAPGRVRLDALTQDDAREFVAAVARSRALHGPWTSPPSTSAAYRTWLARMQPPAARAFAVRRVDDAALVGVFNVTNIVMGLFRSAYLGYYAFAPHAGQGLMREGLDAVVRVVFGTMKLHRLEANIQPGNRASIALVRACGFAKEGYSPRYLKIGGRWRDHERWAIIADRRIRDRASP